MSGEGLVLREDRGRVALLTLNRPEQLNAWSRAMEEEYFDHLEAIDAEPDVRAVVLTGAGRAFCAGADMADLAAAAGGERRAEPRRPRHYPLAVNTPIVAAINGPAVALGLVQALFCDVRFAAEDAKLITLFARRGLVAEFGVSWLLTNTVGRGRALELLLSGRPVEGAEAAAIGLVERSVPKDELLARAIDFADELAELSSPYSMARMKAQVRYDLERSFAESYEESQRLMDESLALPDVREGVASFQERRKPRFAGWAPAGEGD
jgi:enoyl-CoA hydratase/carnithine racemase